MTRRLCIAIILSALTYIVVPSSAMVYAQTPPPAADSGTPAKRDLETRNASGKTMHCADVAQAKGGILLGYIVPCMVYTIEDATVTFSQKMIDWLRPAMYAFITFALVMFGLKVVQSAGQEIHKEAFVLLIKIAFIIGMMDIIPQLVPEVYGIIGSSQEVVSSVVGESGIKCDIAHYKGEKTPLIWAQMDCLVGKLYGFTTGKNSTTGAVDANQPNMLLGASALGLMGGFFFGGTLGVSLFLVLIGVLWSILQVVIKVALAFINGYLIVCLMLIISPLFLPLVLLRATQPYFENWWKLILGGVLLPVIVTAYAMFAMLMYDGLLFSDTALIKTFFDNKLMQDAQKLPRKACTKTTSGRTDFRDTSTAGGLSKMMQDPFLQNFVKPLLSGNNDLCGNLTVPNFDITAVNSPLFKGKDAKKLFTDLFQTAIKLLIMSILIEEGLKTFINSLRTLVPSSSAAASIGAVSKTEQQFQQRFRQAKQEMLSAYRDDKGNDISGGEFLKSTPRAVTGALKGLINPNSE